MTLFPDRVLKFMVMKATSSKTSIYSVIGADTYLGAHMLKHLRQTGQRVIGIAHDETFHYNAEPVNTVNSDKIPEDTPAVDAEWIVICIDPDMGFEKYTRKMKKLLDGLTEHGFAGDICFLSSASICMAEMGEPISEHATVYPRNEQGLALATGENLLKVFACGKKGYAVPHIMRFGVPYGNEIGVKNPPCFVNRMIADAEKKSPLRIPLCGNAKRSLTHISDLCDSVIELMASGSCPPLVNIPGEVKTIHEAGSAISARYRVVFSACGLSGYDDPDYFAGDQHLSEKLFRETVKYTPAYTFEHWLDQVHPL